MKIFFLQGLYPFCYYYRGYLPAIYSNNIAVSDFLRKDMDISNEKFVEKAMQADIISFQRPTSKASYELAKLLKLKGKKIIMDNDDTYSGVPLARLGSEKQVEIAKELNKNLEDFCIIADGITVSTEFLAKEYSRLNPNVIVCKNCIDPIDAQKCKPNTTGKFRIGLVGSVTTNDDYIHIKDQLKKLSERDDCTIVIMGLKMSNGKLITESFKEDAEFWMSLKNVEWHPTCHVTEYMGLVANLALDLAIIPRKEHYFNQCKSNLKFLEMSLLEIPVLAQAFSDGTSPYQGVDEPYMTLTANDWYDNIIKIKDNYEEYKEKAKKAKAYVLENYNIINEAPKWAKKIENL